MSEPLIITIDYGRHKHDEPWKRTDYFCPSCGKKSVWNNCDGGDYYQGETFACVSCDAEWNWPSEPRVSPDKYDAQRMLTLRDAIKAMEG